MENVTPSIFTETKVRGCNPSFVVTSDGVVIVDDLDRRDGHLVGHAVAIAVKRSALGGGGGYAQQSTTIRLIVMGLALFLVLALGVY